MRDAKAWRTALVRDLTTLRQLYGSLSMPVAQFLDTELVLTLLADHLPGFDPSYAWIVLNGHSFPALAMLPAVSQRAIAIARLRLPELLGRRAWQRNLAQYKAIPKPYALYAIDGNSISLLETPVLPERLDAMRGALSAPPLWEERKPKYAPEGRYRFYLDRDPHEVEIPRRVAALAPEHVDLIPRSPLARAPLRFSFAELQETADWMDKVAPKGSAAEQSWGERIRDLQLALVGPQGLTPGTELIVNGLLHLIGMVGSGKSSLFMVLAVHLARCDQRVTLVQGDVASILRAQEVFDILGQFDPKICAIPMVGRSTRIAHLNRLAVAEARRAGPSLSRDHVGYAMLSTVCPLDGLRHDVEPLKPGQEPCTRLFASGQEETAAHRYDCPLLPICPIHLPTQSLMQSLIWLATPASLLASSPQDPLIPERIRNIELVMRASTVLLIDEADMVQVQFDNQFAQIQVLVGKADSWLDRLAPQVARQVYRPGRPLVGTRSGFDRWLTAHMNTQRAVDRLYYWLRENVATRVWLRNSYFSTGRLLPRVVTELAKLGGNIAAVERAMQIFMRTTFGSVRVVSTDAAPPDAWMRALQAELFTADGTASLREIKAWFQEAVQLDITKNTLRIDALAHALRIALLVGVLDHALQDVIDEWSNAADVVELDRGSGGLFYAPSDSLTRLVPEAPMGSVLGFQYFDPDNKGDGELRFFKVRGIGRALLYRLHNGFLLTDNVAGPQVILTSGTSWAPTSWRYDLHVPPDAVLLPLRRKADQAKKVTVTCFFDPLPDPDNTQKMLAASGRGPMERMRSLRAMAVALAEKRGFHEQSMFDQELALLHLDRRRILVVVGSYDEALEVADALTETLGAKPGEVAVALIPDQEIVDSTESRPGTLIRSMLPQFPDMSATFLVAPLQSIERGHNILVGQEAAIGSVYFLIRPLPVPGDPYTAIQRLNAWAMRTVPTMVDLEVTAAGKQLREQANRRWDDALNERENYIGTMDRTALLWTQLVLVWQCIGRLLRGGVDARVHFIDAKWAEVSGLLKPGTTDTEETSMLLGFRRILREVLADPDPMRRAIADVLYGPFAAGLEDIKGVLS
jgi:hypothetical protein